MSGKREWTPRACLLYRCGPHQITSTTPSPTAQSRPGAPVLVMTRQVVSPVERSKYRQRAQHHASTRAHPPRGFTMFHGPEPRRVVHGLHGQFASQRWMTSCRYLNPTSSVIKPLSGEDLNSQLMLVGRSWNA